MKGISVIICCYNSAWIIEKTLNALLNQQYIGDWGYEIIIVDNNCQDDTKKISQQIIQSHVTIETKIINESTGGLMYARKRGIQESKYEYILFCDDDNILCPTYVSSIFETFEKDPQLGACGGVGIAQLQGEKPNWFAELQLAYACGLIPQQNYLYGAGCAFRSSILKTLHQTKYPFLLTGRKGKNQLAGDDTELCLITKYLGFNILQIQGITFEHIIQRRRLTTKYLYQMFEGFGKSAKAIYMYQNLLSSKRYNRLIYIIQQFILIAQWLKALIRTLINNSVANRAYFRMLDSAIKYSNNFPYSLLIHTSTSLQKLKEDYNQ